MAVRPVEWVLVIYYGPSAHRATYGRLANTKYTKDYIQLSKKSDFLDVMRRLFPISAGNEGSVPLTYKWPTGTTPGSLVFNSADRPHLKWETNRGAPKAWKMSQTPSDKVAETIPGDPKHIDFEAAESELAMLATRGAGQPYLVAIKLHDEPTILHLRAYLDSPSVDYAWANLEMCPAPIQGLARKTSQNSALAWETFASGGVVPSVELADLISRLDASSNFVEILDELDGELGRGLASYLRRPGYGVFFDSAENHSSWVVPAPLSGKLATSVKQLLEILDKKFPLNEQGDAVAEASESDLKEVEAFEEKITSENYSVPDTNATVKTRGSAQRVFANAVKSNYGYRCAITGIQTTDFLVASHIVPWSEDQSIRLDPSNGICLSLLMDRAFEKGHLLIQDDLTLKINLAKVGKDLVLLRHLETYDGKKLFEPKIKAPKVEYLQRRRALISSID